MNTLKHTPKSGFNQGADRHLRKIPRLLNMSRDGDTSSFFFCSNVLWSLRSKRSALRARMQKYASGEF